MDFRTPVAIPPSSFLIEPQEQMLFVGSCFATSIGLRFEEDMFRATVNPFGVMYNPVSILHTVQATDAAPRVAVLTLGTNHVYRLNATGQVVDNCQKRPQNLFTEQALTVEACLDMLVQAAEELKKRRHDVEIIVTVSPIRYAKYGFHGSRLSKATLLLAADALAAQLPYCHYFPAYEILEDELRDYRFYAADMLHPSDQAAEYIYSRFADTYFSPATRDFLSQWKPVKEALAHRPLFPDSDEYKAFRQKAIVKLRTLVERYPAMNDIESVAKLLG